MKTIKIVVENTSEPEEYFYKIFQGENIPKEVDEIVSKHVGGRPNDRKRKEDAN